MSSTKSRKNLTFSQRLEILKEGEKSSQRAVVGVSLGVVNCVVKRKLELETLAENNCHHAAKRVKNEDLNEKMWEWFVAARFILWNQLAGKLNFTHVSMIRTSH